MKDIFDESDLRGSDTSIVIVSSIYYRNKWLYSPTVLNDTMNFRIKEFGKNESIKMYRINGMMPYANIIEWDAQVI